MSIQEQASRYWDISFAARRYPSKDTADQVAQLVDWASQYPRIKVRVGDLAQKFGG